jgi:hypothetical protein
MAKTRTIVIDQEALEPWARDIDLIDAALIHHVTIRLTRRAKQHIISPEGIPLAWIHYPTVRAENWLLSIDDRSLQRRFQKLVRLKLLIRRQISLGREKGSRSYFGISEELKARFEETDEVRHAKNVASKRIEATKMSGAYEPPFESGAYEPPKMAGQSLSMSQSESLSASYSPGQEKHQDRQAAIHGLRRVLRSLPGGEKIVAQIEAREEKKA